MAVHPKVFVISGVGGAGKGTIVDRLHAARPDLWWSVSWATRPQRADEVDGIHYHFCSREEFEQEVARGGFLEWFEPYGHLKGTPKEPIVEALRSGSDCLVELDIDGALAVSEAFGDQAQVVFLVAPSAEVQAERLRGRGDDAADVETRIARAETEIDKAASAGFKILVNEDFERTFAQVVAILGDRTVT